MSKKEPFFVLPPFELSPEKEEEMTEKLSKFILNWGMDFPFIVMGSGLVPFTTTISQITLLPLSPFLELFGIPGYELAAFFGEKRSLRRLLARVEELRNARQSGKPPISERIKRFLHL